MSNETLVAELIRNKSLNSPKIIEAFLNVDRKDFVPEQYEAHAYEDNPLPLGYGSTISQPTTVAITMELLKPEEGQKILDVGSGSGWTTAILAEVVGPKGKVYGVEVDPKILELGTSNLKKYDYKNVKNLRSKKEPGLPEQAPFDRILVSAAADKIPQELTSQLKIGGIMVIPVEHSLFQLIRVSEDQVEAQEYPGFSFVPLR